MRRPLLAFVAASALAGAAFAPASTLTLDASLERLSDPLSFLDGANTDDLPGPGDLVHSVENIPAGLQGDLAPTVHSAKGFNPEPVARIDVLALKGTRHASIPLSKTDKPTEIGGVVRGGNAKDLGTFMEFFSPTVEDEDGNDVEIDVAIMGVNDMGALLIDVTDPTQPELLSILNCGYHQADVGAYQLDDGRWIVGVGADEVGAHEDCMSSPISPYFKPGAKKGGGGQEAITFFDVTNPRTPVALSSVATDISAIGASHTNEFHPTLPIAYIATALDPRVEVVDFSDPENPTITGSVDTAGNPHAVRVSDDGTRMYSAGSFAQNISIHDVTDPNNSIPLAVSSGPRNIYTHEVLPAHDKSFILITDEGAYDPGYDSGYCPGTGFWLYDLTVENTPIPMSYTVADIDGDSDQACASHYGNVSHDDRYYTMAYYGAGVRVFDLIDPLDPVEVGHMMFEDSDVWTAKSYKDGNYVFISDLIRGFEVYEWTGEGSLANEAPAE